MVRRGILAIDEGTTGTRAAVVLDDLTVGHLHYRPVALHAPDAPYNTVCTVADHARTGRRAYDAWLGRELQARAQR